jgi:multidrug efflux pump subunit AcrA (membrane-fusion protein)
VALASSAAAAVAAADSSEAEAEAVAAAVPNSSHSGWSRSGHRRAVLISAVVLVVILGGGVAAWAEVNGGSAGYRMASVTRADIGTTLTVVGNVEPVSDAAASFQVAGQVATLTATPGQQVTAGQSLGTLQTTALSESVSSSESTLSADEAKLVEDEESQASQASPASSSKTPSSTPSTTTTTTTTPTHSGTGTSGQSATITQDQNTLTQDQSTLSTDQQKEGADLAQAQSDCTSANTSTPAGQATCESALETVSADEQQVSKDQTTVSKDETALGQAVEAAPSSGSGSDGGSGSGVSGNSGSSPTQSGHALSTEPEGFSGNTGAGAGGTGSGTTGSGSSADTDTPEQIASDQADIDTAEADLTGAEQSLNEATLASPISGTIVSVGIDVGETVSADSATDIITIIGTKSYEVQATLDSSQVPSVKVGQSASVEVDGVNGTLDGTVSQVGPVESSDSGYDYPVIVALPSSAAGVLFTGSSANVNISTGAVSNVVAVPTSAVQTTGSRSYVLELSKGELTTKVIKIGMVGDTYTQVISGLTPGESVILADYAEAVPSSNTDTVGGVGSFLNGGGAGGGFFGGGAGGFIGGGGGGFKFQRTTAVGAAAG